MIFAHGTRHRLVAALYNASYRLISDYASGPLSTFYARDLGHTGPAELRPHTRHEHVRKQRTVPRRYRQAGLERLQSVARFSHLTVQAGQAIATRKLLRRSDGRSKRQENACSATVALSYFVRTEHGWYTYWRVAIDGIH